MTVVSKTVKTTSWTGFVNILFFIASIDGVVGVASNLKIAT